MSNGRLGEFIARILVDFETDRIIDDALASITCNSCGCKGLRRVARVAGEPGFERGKQKAICKTCGTQQWKPCDDCNGSGATESKEECSKCGGSGLYGKVQAEACTEDAALLEAAREDVDEADEGEYRITEAGRKALAEHDGEPCE